MNKKPLHILLVEDNAGDVRLLREMFREEGPDSFELTHLIRMSEAETRLEKGGVDIVLLDMGLPDEHGLDTVRRTLAAAPDVPVIVLTGLEDETLASEAMKAGAQDYLIKGQIENRALPRALRHAIERYQLDQRLRDQQFYSRSLIESSIDALVTTDPVGIITDVNQQMEALTECTRDDLIGQPFKYYFTDPHRAETGIRRVLSERKIRDYELTARGRDGKETVVSYNFTTFHDRHQKLRGVFAAARDVTERKRLERAIEDNNCELKTSKLAAEKANRAKSDFLSNMSHEIRTPMNAILGMADMLSESHLDSDQRQYVEIFRRAGSALIQLINNILDLSKIEAGHFEVEHVELDLKEVMDHVIELTAVSARAKGIVLRSHLSPDVTTLVMGDALGLRQVLINLLGNTIKFAGSGEVLLTVHNDGSGQPGQVEFAVSDTGIGIASDKLEIIFDDFTQADTSTTRQYGGTGLGLGISRRLVEAMGGILSATSVLGMGSTFRFTIGFDSAPKKEAEFLAAEGKPPVVMCLVMPLRILVAEDSADNQMLVRIYLKEEPHTLTFVENGEEAVAAFKDGGLFDLILMDIQMPRMDGLSATRAIRASERRLGSVSIPIIAVSANARDEEVQSSLAAGCTAHVSKPISKSRLLEAIFVQGFSGCRVKRAEGEILIHIPKGFEELTPRYLEARRKDAPQLRNAMEAGDFKTVGTIGHKLAGSGEPYGFVELTELGAALELAAKANDRNAMERHVVRIDGYFGAVRLVSEAIPPS